MRDASAALWKALRSGGPIVVVLYEDAEQREALISEMEVMALQDTRRGTEVEEAFREPESVLFLVPADEREAVLSLDGRREALVNRSAPVVLLLVRAGDGVRSLDETPGLASWVQGTEVEPYRMGRIDVEGERERFRHDTGQSPEDWLAAWRAGRLSDTLENGLWATRAGLLEEPA